MVSDILVKRSYCSPCIALVVFLLIWVFTPATTSSETVTNRSPDFQRIDSSPTIAGLRKLILAGESNAIDEFWRRAKQTGTPILENSESDPHEVIVIFLWRGDSGTKSVELLAPLAKSPGMPRLPLTRLLDTDVWYSSWRMKDDLRFGYRFVLNAEPGGRYNQQNARTDPLNPHSMEVALDEGGPGVDFSIAAMPLAREPQWIEKQRGVPEGKVEKQEFKSTILGNERAIWIYTPTGYDARSHAPYPLLLLFDGFEYQNWIPAPMILDNLIRTRKVPPLITIFIGNAPGARMEELTYSPKFLDFVCHELLPWVHQHWNVTSDPQKTIIGGYSAGGAAAAFFALTNPDLFGNVLSQSGSFQDGNEELATEWLAHQYQSHPKLPIHFFIEAGRLENISRGGPTLLGANRDFVAVLKKKAYVVTYNEVGGTHEPAQWRAEFGLGLVALMK